MHSHNFPFVCLSIAKVWYIKLLCVCVRYIAINVVPHDHIYLLVEFKWQYQERWRYSMCFIIGAITLHVYSTYIHRYIWGERYWNFYNTTYWEHVDILISKNQTLQILYLKHRVYNLYKLSWIRNLRNPQKFSLHEN